MKTKNYSSAEERNRYQVSAGYRAVILDNAIESRWSTERAANDWNDKLYGGKGLVMKLSEALKKGLE